MSRIATEMEEDNRKSDPRPYNLTPEKMHRTTQECGSSRRDAKTHSEEVKRKIHYTPQNSPDKYQKTSQNSGSYRKEARSLSESNKRKGPPSHGESLEKIPKVCPSGKFVNTLIGQWSKYTGVPTPSSQLPGVQENSMVEEIRRVYATEERKIQLLQKKLQAAEETISSLSASRETELRAKEEILRQLNTDWESITKYYYEISESLKGFQQHKDNLSALYNNVILRQQSAMKKVQEELGNMKLKDEEQRSIVAAAESKVIKQEKRIQEIMIVEDELKKQLENFRSNAVSEMNRLNNTHAEERVELIKKQEKLTSMNEELLLQLKSVADEKLNSTKLFQQKEKEIAKLEEEISTRKNKNEELLCENAELGAKYKKLVDIKEELSKQLESKVQEIDRLRDNLDTRQEIESSLAKDLDMIEIKYRTTQTDLLNAENKLKETQTRNVELEKSMQDIKYNKEISVMELNKTIQILTKEKEAMLLEKRAKIQEVENSQKSLQEKHELEVAAMKKDFDTKLSEMKKTIATQNSAFTKFNESLTKEKEAILLEKRAKIQEVENSQKSLQEKHELEVAAMKKDFDTKLSEMKKTIATQNSAFIKLNESVTKEKEAILSEKRAKIQEVENSQKSLQEKHELEVAAMKKDFDTKLSEMKKTIATQNSAFIKLNESLTKEKEAILSEKRAKIQKVENSQKSLQEKHELQVSALKKDFETKLSEMKKTIATQNSAFTKLNESLTKEKEAILSEKRAKIQELEKSQKSLQEKHELEVSALKKDFDTKLSETKKTLATQNSAFTKLNENLSQMADENLKRPVKPQSAKGEQDNLKEKSQLFVKSKFAEPIRTYETGSQSRLSQTRERRGQQSQVAKKITTPKRASKDKQEMSSQEKLDSIYDFKNSDSNHELPKILSQVRLEKKIRFDLRSPSKIYEYTENSSPDKDKAVAKSIAGSQPKQEQKKEDSDDTPQKRKYFKTRGAMVRQYGTPRTRFKN